MTFKADQRSSPVHHLEYLLLYEITVVASGYILLSMQSAFRVYLNLQFTIALSRREIPPDINLATQNNIHELICSLSFFDQDLIRLQHFELEGFIDEPSLIIIRSVKAAHYVFEDFIKISRAVMRQVILLRIKESPHDFGAQSEQDGTVQGGSDLEELLVFVILNVLVFKEMLESHRID